MKMKRLILVLALASLLLCSCAERAYSPDMLLAEGYYFSDDAIKADFVNVYYFSPYDDITALDGGELVLYRDRSWTEMFEGGDIELFDGTNTFALVVSKDDMRAEYDLIINCVMIRDFYIAVLSEKTYRVGDIFDRGTISVTAKKEDGEMIQVENYGAEYDFSVAGQRRVRISYGKIVHDIFVEVV